MLQSTNKEYDYIISGAGCAGISLLLRILAEPTLQHKKILLIDKDIKQQNDRTWCFWEQGSGFFESLVHYQWSSLVFHSPQKSILLDINPYQYKMIRGIDFFNYAKQIIASSPNVTWLRTEVLYVNTGSKQGFVHTKNETYYGEYVFNSIFLEEEKLAFNSSNCYKLSQHFKGWFVETEEPTFNPEQASFMDFRVDQELGTAFVYVLPTSTTKALVEYTFFNTTLLDSNQYDLLLKNYLDTYYKGTTYKIVEEENGIIPMTNFAFTKQRGRVINIGTVGGYTKASSGFTFQFTQKNTAAIVKQLIKGLPLEITSTKGEKRFNFYDATLLNILHHNKMQGSAIFYKMFNKLKGRKVLAFLDNDTSLIEELSILSSVPISIFLPAGLQEMFKK